MNKDKIGKAHYNLLMIKKRLENTQELIEGAVSGLNSEEVPSSVESLHDDLLQLIPRVEEVAQKLWGLE